MKFKVKDMDKSKKKLNKIKTATPSKFKVVDIDESSSNAKSNSKSSKKKETKSPKKSSKHKQNNSTENSKPNLNLLVSDKEEEFGEDIENEFSDDGENDDGDYEQFMEEMAKIDGKKKKIVSNRGEGLEMTEYSMASTKTGKIDSTDLLSALDTANEDVRKLSARLTKTEGELKLDTALDDVQAARVTREAGYTGVKKDISVWDAVVHSRRAADTLNFPLKKADLRIKSLNEDGEKFKAETSLEQQVAAMLAGADSVAADGEELSKIEQKCLEGLTVREAMERKQELAKIRALQTYQEQKFRRMKKIKSKKFRKIERKMKKKDELAEIEQLSKLDPEAAAEKLEALEKDRIKERASLKHRNASKYLHDVAKRAKLTKNKDLTNVVQDQLRKHRTLTTKQKETLEDDDQGEGEHIVKEAVNVEGMSVDEFNSDYRKYWEDNQAKKQAEKADEDIDELFDEADHKMKTKLRKTLDAFHQPEGKSSKEDASNEQEEENPTESLPTDSLNYDKAKKVEVKPSPKPTKADLPNVNPDDIINMKADKVGSDLPDIVGYNDLEEDEEDNDQRNMIAEAFADDDVVDEFRKEKRKLTDSLKPKNIDLTLPGWGEWGGGGAMPSKRKRRRFTIKAPPPEKRRDENSGHLILNTDKDTALRKHQVSNIPFPFQSVSDFESSIRAPVGSTFIPRTAHLKMIKPRVTTKTGHIIEPMDRDQLVKRGLVDITAKS